MINKVMLLFLIVIFMDSCSSESVVEGGLGTITSIIVISVVALFTYAVRNSYQDRGIDKKNRKEKKMKEEEEELLKLRQEVIAELEDVNAYADDAATCHTNFVSVINKKYGLSSKDEPFIDALCKCKWYASDKMIMSLKDKDIPYTKADLNYIQEMIASAKSVINTTLSHKKRIVSRFDTHEKRVLNFLAIMPALHQQVIKIESNPEERKDELFSKLSQIKGQYWRYVQEADALKNVYKTILKIK